MVRKAELYDLDELVVMMYELYKDINPKYATNDMEVYKAAVLEHFADDRDTIYIDDTFRGFFIVRDESEPMTPGFKRYNGIRVYIYPEHRRSNLLAKFYKRLFKDFPEGEILGVTEINSDHIQVLDKRHNLVAQVYKLERK